LDTSTLTGLVEAILGVYMLYAAVTGKGKIYENENLVKGKEAEYYKLMRVFCSIGGPLALLNFLFDYLKLELLAYIALIILILGTFYIAVRIYRMTQHKNVAK
jgi:hypothetical protein